MCKSAARTKSRCAKRLARFLGGSYGQSADFDLGPSKNAPAKKAADRSVSRRP